MSYSLAPRCGDKGTLEAKQRVGERGREIVFLSAAANHGTPNSLRQIPASVATPWLISSWLKLAKHSRTRLLACALFTDHSAPVIFDTRCPGQHSRVKPVSRVFRGRLHWVRVLRFSTLR
jgi:hypothetical protein